ncbi:hypothetical protein Q7A36_31785 [Paracraurococcus sp. LOR1-02]|uniref:Transposase n=1 Tax=Paracraurococcus lichenis TaxID=3064888 RepID=A0ABT9E9V1_9PROT|nr:hypothetical protein [Paracraurococcus sp. LOR1-02]MDO9712953.1 hypothetical protein [Paracraurococcus sp. LOR1-02]
MFSLPGCSPELNPDEGVNGDLKQAVIAKEPARNKAQLRRVAIGHMRKLSKPPDRVRSVFGHKTFRYAAWLKITQTGSVAGHGSTPRPKPEYPSPAWTLPCDNRRGSGAAACGRTASSGSAEKEVAHR